MLDKQVRILPLGPIFDITAELSNTVVWQHVYAMFYAARRLLVSMQNDTEEFLRGSLLAIPLKRRRFPNMGSLKRTSGSEDRIYFDLMEQIGSPNGNRCVYIAKPRGDTDQKTILVRFTQKYGKELHDFCTEQGFAPRLLAYEELPGGWFGVTMEYLAIADYLVDAEVLRRRPVRGWVHDIDRIVGTLHEHGFVHGDLRMPNFLAVDESLFLILTGATKKATQRFLMSISSTSYAGVGEIG